MTSRFVCQQERILLGVGRRDYKIIPKIVGGRVIGMFWIIGQKISALLR